MNSKPEPVLEVKHLSNHFEGQPLLQDVSFSLERGEILCLLGPSGSGKTTLLRLIGGLEQQEFGEIHFNDRNLERIPPNKRNFGMMFQEYALFPHKNVWQNISFGLEMQACPPAEKEKRVASMLKMVGLEGFEHRKIDELSGGERQRVALARSLAPEPQLLLLDEPLGSLDRALRDRLTGEIRNILKTLGVTAIFVTHDQAEAFSIGDKVAVLHNGILQQLDTPEDLYRQPRNDTVARFLGFSNLIEGRIDADNVFHSPLGPLQLPEYCGGLKRLATLLIRPEGASLYRSKNDETTNSIAGTVVSRQFHGSRYKVELQSGEVRLRFDLPIEPVPPQAGNDIKLVIHRSAMVLVAE